MLAYKNGLHLSSLGSFKEKKNVDISEMIQTKALKDRGRIKSLQLEVARIISHVIFEQSLSSLTQFP